MSGFDILSLVGEPWNDSGAVFRGIGVTVTDTASLPSSKFLEFVLNGAPIYRVLKTGETIISNSAGTSLGGIKLAGAAGEMALTSLIDSATAAPGEVLRYSWEDTAHVGNDPASGAVLQGMGARNFSIEGPATITHIAGNSAYNWAGVLGPRLSWAGYEAATANGKTIDFTNLGQTSRASPIVSVSAQNVADDLIHFGLTNGSTWSVAAKIDAAGRGRFQMLDLPEQGAPGNPSASTARIYGKNVGGATKIAFRDSAGAETVLGSTVSVAGGTVTANTPVASFAQTWNNSGIIFSAITADITDTQSRVMSTLIDLKVGGGSVFQVRKNGETVISNAAGTSLGGIRVAGNLSEMALTSQINPSTGTPADVLRYYWEGAVGAIAVLRGMGTSRLSIESASSLGHLAGNNRHEWKGHGTTRLTFTGSAANPAVGKTIDFTNVGQSSRANPIISVAAANVADDLIHFGVSDGTTWTVAAKIDAAGRGRFQVLDLPEQASPGNPTAATVRLYGKNIGGVTKIAFRESSGAETVLGASISVSGGTVTSNAPAASFAQTWNNASVAFSAVAVTVTDTQSHVTSKLIDLKVSAGTVFQVRKNGETVISNTAGTSLGGIRLAGNAGEMALTSQIHPSTGTPADVLRYYWDGAVGQVAVLKGLGSNRLSIESSAAMVHIADNSRYEWEGWGPARLSFVGFEKASAIGKTIDFNNYGQNPTRASPVVSISVQNPADDPLHIGSINGAAWTTLSRFDGTGALYSPALNATGTGASVVVTGDGGYVDARGRLGSAPGFIARITGDAFARSFLGLDAANNPFMSFGTGSSSGDTFVIRDAANILAMRNANSPDTAQEFRVYNKYSSAGANYEFGSVGWRGIGNWFRIGCSSGGTGAPRNMYLDPTGGIVGLGGTTAAFPALRRASIRLQGRLADDSDFCPVQGKLMTHANAVAETIVPDRTLILYDAAGTAYRVPCVAA